MAKLIYSAIVSLDGYICDEDGDFDCLREVVLEPVRRGHLIDGHHQLADLLFGNGFSL